MEVIKQKYLVASIYYKVDKGDNLNKFNKFNFEYYLTEIIELSTESQEFDLALSQYNSNDQDDLYFQEFKDWANNEYGED